MTEFDVMDCGEFGDAAAELALGVLTGRERAVALAHLEGCDACREHVRQLALTGEELLGLVPSQEPPPGFETRVFARLGLAVPAATARPISRSRPRGMGRRGPEGPQPSRPASYSMAAPGMPGMLRRGVTVRAGRTLVATALTVAVTAAGMLGWGLHAATSTPSAQPPWQTAVLLSSTHTAVGQIFYDDRDEQMWVSVAMDSSKSTKLRCQFVTPDGHVSTIGTFMLLNGVGWWKLPAAAVSTPGVVRLVTPSSTVLASAALH
jgi:hypothetical protein